MDYLKQSDLEITAVLDNCQMSLGEIVELQVDDVIALNKRIDEDILVDVEGLPWYTARLGELDKKEGAENCQCNREINWGEE